MTSGVRTACASKTHGVATALSTVLSGKTNNFAVFLSYTKNSTFMPINQYNTILNPFHNFFSQMYIKTSYKICTFLCSLECKDDEFRCLSDGSCIEKRKQCDNVSHCADSSDELDCGKLLIIQAQTSTRETLAGRCEPRGKKCFSILINTYSLIV